MSEYFLWEDPKFSSYSICPLNKSYRLGETAHLAEESYADSMSYKQWHIFKSTLQRLAGFQLHPQPLIPNQWFIQLNQIPGFAGCNKL